MLHTLHACFTGRPFNAIICIPNIMLIKIVCHVIKTKLMPYVQQN